MFLHGDAKSRKHYEEPSPHAVSACASLLLRHDVVLCHLSHPIVCLRNGIAVPQGRLPITARRKLSEAHCSDPRPLSFKVFCRLVLDRKASDTAGRSLSQADQIVYLRFSVLYQKLEDWSDVQEIIGKVNITNNKNPRNRLSGRHVIEGVPAYQ